MTTYEMRSSLQEFLQRFDMTVSTAANGTTCDDSWHPDRSM
jgi:hypothetical protein